MIEDSPIPRRNALALGAAGVVVGGVALVGCGSSDNGSGGGGTAASTAPAGDPTTGSTGSSSAPTRGEGGNALAKVADIPSGGSLKVNGADGKPVILFRSDNTVVAHTGICTHMGCTVNAGGAELPCPCHGSKYNAQTGAVINGPATAPLAEIKVTVSGDSVMAG